MKVSNRYNQTVITYNVTHFVIVVVVAQKAVIDVRRPVIFLCRHSESIPDELEGLKYVRERIFEHHRCTRPLNRILDNHTYKGILDR